VVTSPKLIELFQSARSAMPSRDEETDASERGGRVPGLSAGHLLPLLAPLLPCPVDDQSDEDSGDEDQCHDLSEVHGSTPVASTADASGPLGVGARE
jgi:hypothetical protein